MAFSPKGFKSFSFSMPIWLREKLFQKKFLFDKLKQHDESFIDIKKINFSEHHYSHAASAFFPSPFKEAVILTLDGVGEWATTTVAIGDKNKLEIIKEIYFCRFISWGSSIYSNDFPGDVIITICQVPVIGNKTITFKVFNKR